MEKLVSMFLHLAVPISSSTAFSSRPTSMFCDIYVAQYCRDFAKYECSTHTNATQRETRKM